MKTIIAGGRDYVIQPIDYKLLDQYRAILPITEVVSGGASGADRLGEIWAEMRRIPVCKKAPDTLGGVITFAQAAHNRNQAMADYADALIAFPGGSGTADMIRRAKARKLTIIVVNDSVDALQLALGALRSGE